MSNSKQFPKLEKHVMFPHQDDDDYIWFELEELAEDNRKKQEQMYFEYIKKYWPEFEKVSLDIVCEVFGASISFLSAVDKLEEVRKRLVNESFANEL